MKTYFLNLKNYVLLEIKFHLSLRPNVSAESGRENWETNDGSNYTSSKVKKKEAEQIAINLLKQVGLSSPEERVKQYPMNSVAKAGYDCNPLWNRDENLCKERRNPFHNENILSKSEKNYVLLEEIKFHLSLKTQCQR